MNRYAENGRQRMGRVIVGRRFMIGAAVSIGVVPVGLSTAVRGELPTRGDPPAQQAAPEPRLGR